MPNFIVNKVLFLILVGGRREVRWEERTAVSFVSDEPRKSETTERRFIHSILGGEWNSTKGQRPKRFD